MTHIMSRVEYLILSDNIIVLDWRLNLEKNFYSRWRALIRFSDMSVRSSLNGAPVCMTDVYGR